MQNEKSQPEGKPDNAGNELIMQEMRFTELTASSVYPRAGSSRSASETDDRYYVYCPFIHNGICYLLTSFRILVVSDCIFILVQCRCDNSQGLS